MPFYEYQCQACHAQVEVLQKISDAPLKKCPECGKQKLSKLVSAPVFRLKGSGWYETDFKSEQDTKRNLVGEEKEAAPAADAKDTKDTKDAADAKPEAKPEARPEAAPADKAGKADRKVAAKAAPVARPKARPGARKPKPAARRGKARPRR
jgi:putative FmdB family regulatory protein